jgi:hypothetical protein
MIDNLETWLTTEIIDAAQVFEEIEPQFRVIAQKTCNIDDPFRANVHAQVATKLRRSEDCIGQRRAQPPQHSCIVERHFWTLLVQVRQ